MTSESCVSDARRHQLNILERFVNDPRTTSLRDSYKMSLHTAYLVKRGKVIAEATNRYGSRKQGSGYSERSIHAERNLVKELGDVSRLRGADMYVVRTDARGDSFLCSKPCNECMVFLQKCIKKYGLKNVYYTEHNNNC